MSERGESDIQRLRNVMIKTHNQLMIQIHSRSISDPPLSDMDFKNQIEKVSTILKDIFFKIEI